MPRWIVATIALLASVELARAQPVAVDALPPRPGRLIVKYRSTVSQCAHCMLARHVSFATVTGSDSLDHLDARFGVRGAKALFFDDHGGDRTAHYLQGQDEVRHRHPARATRERSSAVRPDLSNVFVLELGPGADPAAAAAAFSRDPNVEYAEPDAAVTASLTPSDPFFATSGSFGQSFPDLWGLHVTDAEHAWDSANGAGMVVAIVDTGIKDTHPDLKANLWTNPGEIPRNRIDDDANGYVDDVIGWDFVKNKNKPKDRHGHGTHVAGTVAAIGNNGIGVVGMAWGARLMAVRGLDERGQGYTSTLAKGIQYATDNGADVINNSWGGGGRSQTLENAVAAATSQGVIVVFAAGNENAGYSGTASAPGAIAVAATQHDDTRASFSNYGSYVSVAAPGVQVLSTRGAGRVGGTKVTGRYVVLSGTSMAAPHVAGLAAVLLSAQPTLTVDDVRWHLELNADQPGWPGYEGQRFNPYFGYGRINAARVFDAPPATTRLTTLPTTFHALEGTTRPSALTLDFAFTTHDPVDWTVTGPTWLVPDSSSGTGDANVPLTLDTTALGPGSLAGSVALAAPTTVDGGGSVAVAAHVHHDARAGEPFVLSEAPLISADAPGVGSDGQGDLFAWVPWDPSGSLDLVGAYVASDGTITGPFVIEASYCLPDLCQVKNGTDVAVTFDGSAFVVAWNEELHEYLDNGDRRRHDIVKAIRVSAAGQVLAPSVTLVENVETAAKDNSYDEYFFNVRVAADGAGAVVLWGQIDWSESYQNAFHYWTRRVTLSGNAPAPSKQIYPTSDTASPQFIIPRIACLPADGTCLVAWHEADGEIGTNGHYVDKVVGKRFVADVAIDATPRRILRDGEGINGLVAGSGQFLATTYRSASCGTGFCDEVVAARMTVDGTALDPDGVVLNDAGPDGLPNGSLSGPIAAAFDGTNYWVTWAETADRTTSTPTCYPFAARLGSGGVLDAEPSGLLLTADPPRCGLHALTITGSRALLAWIESPGRIVVQAEVVP